MVEYAYRTHRTTVSLAPGETKLFRLPPTTRGMLTVHAKVVLPIGGGVPTVGGGIPTPLLREHAGVAAVSAPSDARTGAASRDIRAVALVDRVSGVTRDQRLDESVPAEPAPARGAETVSRDTSVVRDLRVDLAGSPSALDNPPTHGGGTATPTDLTMELLLGGTISKLKHAHTLSLQSEYVGEVWVLKLTRAAQGGVGEQEYLIEATYPSILPVLSRDIEISAFQRAFDANWNQHPYVTIEMRNERLFIKFDEDFRKLYGLEHYEKDLSVWYASIPNFTCNLRFSMGIAQHPVTVNGVYDAPVMIAEATTSIGVRIKAEFFLNVFGTGAGFTPRATVSGISDNIPGVDVRKKIQDAIQEYLNDLPQLQFSQKFTPWLIGEPHRELLSIKAVSRTRFRVAWVGPAAPPSDGLVMSQEPTGGSGPRPEPPPYLFDTPNETPPQTSSPPLGPRGPVRPYITSPGPLENIRNIVVLMLENRSFDQVLGYLSREAGRTDVNGLSADDRQHVEYFKNVAYPPHRAETTRWPGFDKPGPGHHVDSVEKQMGPDLKMDRFVANFDERARGDQRLLNLVKAYFGPEQLPAYKALTDEFAICDQWFTPHAGPTWPNRFITFTGDLNLDQRGQVEKDNPNLSELTPAQGLTIFDYLSERGIGWRLYEHGYSFLRLFGRYTFETERIVDFRDTTRGFVADARAGRLPPFTFIEPDYVDLPPGNDDHPPADMADGQQLVATIVAALLESPQWQNSLLVITYDEHGGFYDHVPPVDGPPLRGGNVRRGPRVPAFVVSPWVGRGAVSKVLYDHTSIIATVLRTFCSPHPPRLSGRADSANDLRDLILPSARPRSAFNQVHARLVAIRDQRRPPQNVPPPRLRAEPDPDDFHSVMRYVRSFT